MKIRLWPKKRWSRATTVLLVALFLPYGFSRVASVWRSLSVHSASDVAQGRTGPAARGLRIASYNIAHGRGIRKSNWDGGNRAERMDLLDQIAALLRKIDADIVVLNEVDFDASWSHSTNQASYLAKHAGYHYWAEQRNLDFRFLLWTWRFGNAVLSKYPITDAQVVSLPGYSTWETLLAGKKRGIICDIAVGDSAIRVIGTHFSHRSESVRVHSAELLVTMAADSDLPTFVVGDLNSTPSGFPGSVRDRNGNNAVETFDRSGAFQRLPSMLPVTDADLTFHSVEPNSVIDWILIPQDWMFLHYAVELSEHADHRPVYADVANASGTR